MRADRALQGRRCRRTAGRSETPAQEHALATPDGGFRMGAGRSTGLRQKARRLLAAHVRLAQAGSLAESLSAVHGGRRWPAHPLLPREVAGAEGAAIDAAARLAELERRVRRADRSAH